MTTRATTQCDECGSPFFKDSSTMMGLCPECAHVLYGYPPCVHSFDDVGICTRCGWDPKPTKWTIATTSRATDSTATGEGCSDIPCGINLGIHSMVYGR